MPRACRTMLLSAGEQNEGSGGNRAAESQLNKFLKFEKLLLFFDSYGASGGRLFWGYAGNNLLGSFGLQVG